MLSILMRINDELYGKGRVALTWDTTISYFDFIWTDRDRRETMESWVGAPRLTLEYRSMEFSRNGEFAKVLVRTVEPGSQLFYQEGYCLFRRFPEGWRLRGHIPVAIGMGSADWPILMLNEVQGALFLRTTTKRMGLQYPDWASDDEIIRLVKLSVTMFEESLKFPLSEFLSYLADDVLALRRFAHETLVQTFKVDFGFSEEMRPPGSDEPIKWHQPWMEWAIKKFGAETSDRELVPLPRR